MGIGQIGRSRVGALWQVTQVRAHGDEGGFCVEKRKGSSW